MRIPRQISLCVDSSRSFPHPFFVHAGFLLPYRLLPSSEHFHEYNPNLDEATATCEASLGKKKHGSNIVAIIVPMKGISRPTTGLCGIKVTPSFAMNLDMSIRVSERRRGMWDPVELGVKGGLLAACFVYFDDMD